jgi:hypothetical protein
MSKRAIRHALLSILLFGLALPGTIWANGLAYNFEGRSLVLDSTVIDADGTCNHVLVYGAENMFHQPPGNSQSGFSGAIVDIARGTMYYGGDGTSLCLGQQFQVAGIDTFAAPQIQFQPNMKSGSIQATIRGFDWVSMSEVDVMVDLIWIEDGERTIENGPNHYYDEDGSLVLEHNHAVGREALVSGVVSIGAETFPLAENPEAAIFSRTAGTVVLRPR